eukprot:999197-Prymnesium_polylepis.1
MVQAREKGTAAFAKPIFTGPKIAPAPTNGSAQAAAASASKKTAAEQPKAAPEPTQKSPVAKPGKKRFSFTRAKTGKVRPTDDRDRDDEKGPATALSVCVPADTGVEGSAAQKEKPAALTCERAGSVVGLLLTPASRTPGVGMIERVSARLGFSSRESRARRDTEGSGPRETRRSFAFGFTWSTRGGSSNRGPSQRSEGDPTSPGILGSLGRSASRLMGSASRLISPSAQSSGRGRTTTTFQSGRGGSHKDTGSSRSAPAVKIDPALGDEPLTPADMSPHARMKKSIKNMAEVGERVNEQLERLDDALDMAQESAQQLHEEVRVMLKDFELLKHKPLWEKSIVNMC